MNGHMKRTIIGVTGLLWLWLVCCEAGSLPTNTQSMPENFPLLLQFNLAADLIVAGRVVTNTTTGEYEATVLEIEQIIASVWKEADIPQHLVTNGITRKLVILQKVPFGIEGACFLPNGRYLCWLSRTLLPEETTQSIGIRGATFYTPALGSLHLGYGLTSGVVSLTRLGDLVDKEMYEYFRRDSGEDPELAGANFLRESFGIADPDEILRATSRFARLMIDGGRNEEDLRLLVQSRQEIYSRLAFRLLELGRKAQRFRFAQ